MTPIDMPTINDLIETCSFSSSLLICDKIYPIIIPQNTRYPGISNCLAIKKYLVPNIISPLRKISPITMVAKKKNPFMTSKNICIQNVSTKIIIWYLFRLWFVWGYLRWVWYRLLWLYLRLVLCFVVVQA